MNDLSSSSISVGTSPAITQPLRRGSAGRPTSVSVAGGAAWQNLLTSASPGHICQRRRVAVASAPTKQLTNG